ncbi:hypothetical protein WHR41_00954 [Cladosporium halotolerans]|uniref:Protein kinase domain-containing protein n=1 Tax=Cladosporium halotolerans TaxID=1052096 RepID=A0AB34L6P8_9PEZI
MPPTLRGMASVPLELTGGTGRRYRFTKLLQERPEIGHVWTAKSGNDQFVLKDVPPNILATFDRRIFPLLCGRASPLLRLPIDRVPDRHTLVYDYLTDDLFQLVRKGLSMQHRRKILTACAQAIAELHERDVVHLDIKPDNILVDLSDDGQDTTIKKVQLTDLENAAHLPAGKCVNGMLAGNANWRSPEAHFKGDLSKPADIFSFGLVCLFAMTGKIVCGPDADFDKHVARGALPAMIRLQRLVSYFGDREGLEGLVRHVGDEEVNLQVLELLWEDREAEYHSYRRFETWEEVRDEGLREVVLGMLKLDPGRRWTAEQVVGHPWFGGSICPQRRQGKDGT